MVVSLAGRDVLCLQDFTREELETILKTAEMMKIWNKIGKPHRVLEGKTLAMIFQKPSTRTRISFEVGIYQLGGYGLYLNAQDLQLRRGETIADTARVLSRYVDGIMARVFDHKDVEDLAKYASVPVINGLSDFSHPCQALADYQTILEKKGRIQGLKIVYVGDGNNVAHSLMIAGTKLGANVVVATPEGYEPDPKVIKWAEQNAAESGGSFELLHDPVQAVKDADVIYTDVWASMGQEAEAEERRKIFMPFQVNKELVKHAKPDYIFMHCLPAHRGEEVTDDVIDSPNSVVFDQAENRLHAQKAVMALVMGGIKV
ncbi:ornithine carbamoyltransferase [Thermococcus kodakarensis KOD1]|uniref:Ornithine carbamoyltransferase n=1 Tax=Thermococcus kodakarensis (strain ATCC BAA-918 / JCM 12380 / KOD1) TaxID=69014 RepID=OTC_THEKO|nr:ornithine carbamoyltransferase [Thermococcus kodakarensis]Q5JI16.1 RecName: Full=Ornithine carbamoyltransferase; Short=OTCase [Thermococcus kodakarensis KOD1]WCN29240.1 ornithine carbamoyltransferase [Thermococcus kodakarensis]WCN31538.1 ornithine carbamoyltransferase [Thermococcus kodakarensis]BAD85060.1 ornithine carbamoyltransferase [Thermococcus kodakarensis KOD1]